LRNIDKEIKEHIILTCSSNSLRCRALRENLTLDALFKLGRALELSEEQACQVEKAAADINVTETKGSDLPGRSSQRNEHSSQSRFRRSQSRNRQNSNTRNSKPGKCGNCGGYATHRNPCPARGKSCNACGKIGQFAHVCKTNPSAKDGKVASFGTGYSSEDDYEYAYTINYIEGKKPPMCQVQVNGKAVEMMIDTGASVNLLDEATFHRIDCGNKLLEHAHSKIYSYGFDTPLPLLGTPSTTIKSGSNSPTTQLHVVKGNMGNLLSYNTAQKLGLITVSVNSTTVTDVNKNSPESLQEEFECLFGGIGRLRNKIVKLHVDPDITPRQQPHRRIPFHVRGDVEKELERLDRLNIIERVEGPTPWISPIVVGTKKSGEVRICVDMGEANKAVKREKLLMPTIDDLIADLNGATHFSTLDLPSGYHQLELAPESRFVTTFSTHVGLRRYKRLPFGINAASEIFQELIKDLRTGLPGCKNISDDVIVFGKGKMTVTRTFVVFSRDLKTTTFASTRTNASSLRVKSGSMAIFLVPVVSSATLRKLKRYAMQAHRRTPVISSPS